MSNSKNSLRHGMVLAALAGALAFCAGCGGHSNSSGTGGSNPMPGGNVIPIAVNAGPVTGVSQTNIGYVSVTVCVPGTSTCQIINDIQADTGSEGLRVVSS